MEDAVDPDDTEYFKSGMYAVKVDVGCPASTGHRGD
jgi:hypothetical protein